MERTWEDLRRHGRDAHTTVASAGSYHRSFSSSLLDAIYRSIDEGGGTGGGRQREWSVDAGAGAAGKQPHRGAVEERKRTTTSSTQKPGYPRRVPDAVNDQPQRHHRGGSCRKQQHQQRQGERLFANSTSSSSDSSYGGFSSSDAEKPVVLSTTPRPRPIRTSCAPPEARKEKKLPKDSAHKAEGSIGDRFRASKLYRELKKAKTPASPGARLASFLNTLFATAGSTKKATKPAAAGSAGRAAGGDASLCSSASSYSRSRLSRTPSSMGNTAPGGCPDARRPVRFFPVSFVVDDDCRPRGLRGAYAADQKPAEYLIRRGCPPAATQAAEVRRPTREATREFIRGYEERSRGSNGLSQGDERDVCEAAEGDEDDGAASYSSSDLFELENLAAIGGAGGELPVYETTRLEADRGMAQGLGVQRKIEIR